jgi:DUF4097 and DUF4098 domain-containing protein YvlB
MAPIRTPAVLLIVTATTALAGCVVSLDSQGHSAREERTFAVTGVPEVHLTTFDGAIRVQSWDRDEVRIEVEKRGPTEEALKSIEVVAEQTGSRIQVEARRPSGSDAFFGIGIHTSRSARITATVPRASNIVARSGDGTIRIERVDGRAELRTGDGSVKGSELSGEVVVHTGDGSIALQDIDGTVDLTTGDGGVSVSGVLKGVQVSTGDGSVTVRADETSVMTSDWSIGSGDGTIVLYLPRSFDADLDAHTSDGRISSDVEVQMTVSGREDRRTLRGRLGEGGRSLKIRSGDGSIRLRES